jgi:hypothetical protein
MLKIFLKIFLAYPKLVEGEKKRPSSSKTTTTAIVLARARTLSLFGVFHPEKYTLRPQPRLEPTAYQAD